MSGLCSVKKSDSGRKEKELGFVSGNRQCGTIGGVFFFEESEKNIMIAVQAYI